MSEALTHLLRQVRACRICEPDLEDGVRPVLQLSETSRILIAGQAPGRRVHESGVPFDDPSGDRLREWMGVSKEVFYDAASIGVCGGVASTTDAVVARGEAHSRGRPVRRKMAS